MLTARVALVTFALAACAWFVLGIRSANDQQSVTNFLQNRPRALLTRQQESHALSQLHSAAFLNPDGEIEILRAHVLLAAGQAAQARQVLRSLLAREPQNIDGWVALYFTPPPHSADSQLATLRIQQLAPPVPASGH